MSNKKIAGWKVITNKKGIELAVVNAEALRETLSELERVKKERDEFKDFVKLFVKTQQETYGNGIKTHLSMATLSEKAKQLLTPKSE